MQKGMSALAAAFLFGAVAMWVKPAAAFDLVQFTTNFIWCWQHDHAGIGRDALAKKCQEGFDGACAYRNGMPHAEYVKDVMTFYRLNQTEDLRGRYEMCQAHNRRALDYATVSRDEIRRAVRHMIACYPPRRGAPKLPDGAPATSEARQVGIQSCAPL